ncbi:GAF domain-containing protein [Dermacoccaceae bacterium W4C1]
MPTPRSTMTGPLRAQISESWARSANSGVTHHLQSPPITLPESDLRSWRAAHPLARVLPLLEDVLGPAVQDCDALLAVGDEQGQLLWVSGSGAALRRADRIGFVPGSSWDERLAGTNAPGTALALDQPVMVAGEEHFRESVRAWSCVATPIHDPRTSRLLGVLDVTGGPQLVVPQTMAMVRAAARLAEAELALGAGAADQVGGRSADLTVEGLGRAELLLRAGDSAVRLGGRHSEIVALLARHPRGLTGEELAELVYPEDVSPATVRAELNRLRSVLGEDVIGSRPYRLIRSVTTDWDAVHALLETGDLDAAMRVYRGRLLLRSQSPGVERMADDLEWALRAAVLSAGRVDLMAAWTRSSWGADDLQMWQAQEAALPPSSPLRAMVTAQIDRLDAELGIGPQTTHRAR